MDATVSSALSAINISCTCPLVFYSRAWLFGNEVERYPIEWKMIGCVGEDLRNCLLLHIMSQSDMNAGNVASFSFSREFYIHDEMYLLSGFDIDTGMANQVNVETSGATIDNHSIVLGYNCSFHLPCYGF